MHTDTGIPSHEMLHDGAMSLHQRQVLPFPHLFHQPANAHSQGDRPKSTHTDQQQLKQSTNLDG